jgi:RNA-directed DNA polymerase
MIDILPPLILHGLETYIKSTNPKLGVVRYADDFLVTARDKESLEKAQILIQQWMSERGLELSTGRWVASIVGVR